MLPATRHQAWTTLVWEGNPGDTVAFVVKSDMVAWQEVQAVATNAEGVLRRLSIGGPALFGRQWQQVPEVSYDYIANAVDRRTFSGWVEQHAKPEPCTFKLVIGWRDRDDRGTNDNGSRMAR